MDSQFYKGKRVRRGVSLIEVLVVLVILVVGILTIIRLFPSGFFSIQSIGNAGGADTLATGALGTASQNAQSFPEAILVNDPVSDDLPSAKTNASTNSNYDPDDPNNLDKARVVSNETITVPSPSSGRSIYAVQFGPIAIGTPTTPQNPVTGTPTALSAFVSVNSPPWALQSGNSVTEPNIKDDLVLNRPNYLVDYTAGQIALPYADYSRGFVLTVVDANNAVHTLYLTVPKQHAVDTTNYLFGPITNTKTDLQISEPDDYNGRWFDPADSTLAYAKSQVHVPIASTALVTPWRSVSLYRPYNWTQTTAGLTNFTNDPYEFALSSYNIGGDYSGVPPGSYANPGAIAFNPLAGGSTGFPVLKAQISYITATWKILREDHDIPSLTGVGSTFVARTTVPNLKLAGSANPDNVINLGIAGSNNSIVILDLDTGQIVAPASASAPGYDPTNADAPVNNEDLNSTNPGPNQNLINVSYSTGRLTFGSNAFGDNSAANGSGTAKPHQIRIFYTADLDWTVAVQKPAAYFSELVTTPTAGAATGTTALAADQFSYDKADAFVYFARCNSGKTVEIDGTYTSGATTKSFSDIIAIDPILYALGDSALRVNLADGTKFEHPVPAGATVTFSAVRGLSARSVVAWKERNRYKVHSVDTLLNRTP